MTPQGGTEARGTEKRASNQCATPAIAAETNARYGFEMPPTELKVSRIGNTRSVRLISLCRKDRAESVSNRQSDSFWRERAVLRDTSGLTDDIRDDGELLSVGRFDLHCELRRERVPDRLPPERAQRVEFGAEQVQGIVDVEHILGTLARRPQPADQQFVRNETHRIGNQHTGWRGDRGTDTCIQCHGPWLGQQQLDIP